MKLKHLAALIFTIFAFCVSYQAAPVEKEAIESSTPALIGMAALTLEGCNQANTPSPETVVKDVLTATQIACIFASAFTVPEQVAEACGIDAKLVPLITQLIGQREAAKKSGVRWQTPDGG